MTVRTIFRIMRRCRETGEEQLIRHSRKAPA